MYSGAYVAPHHSRRNHNSPRPTVEPQRRPKYFFRRWTWRWAVALGVFVALGTWLAGMPGHRTPPISADQLVAQMEAAATGNATSTHIFGGKLSVEQVGGQVAVTAEDVPTKACVSATMTWLPRPAN